MKKFMYLFLLMLAVNTSMAQQNVIEKGEDQLKMFNAQQRFFAGDYQSALNLYRDVLSGNTNDANVLARIGECYFALEMYPEAQEYAEKAKAINEKAYENTALYLGKILHMNGKLDEALTEYTFYKNLVGPGKKAEDSDIDMLIEQITTAKTFMAKPVDVKVENMGSTINSKFDDKAPMVSANGKSLIFTSRRPGKSSALDLEGDKKYFEDIYIARFDSLKRTWSDAELVQGSINTDAHDACTSISPDGKSIYMYKNDVKDKSRGGDVYVSRVSSTGKWAAPKAMEKPVNTSFFEAGACISADGKTLFVISERLGGLGRGDIYMLKKKTRTEWESKAINLGPDVNTTEDEGGIFLAPDGKTLFFTSKGHNSMGGYDIFKTVLENGEWSKPVNLGYPINTVNNDLCFSVSVDAQTGYFTSDRSGGMGERDLYKVDLSNYPVLEKEMVKKAENTGPPIAILSGTVFNGSDGRPMDAEVKLFDEKGAYVGSTSTNAESGDYFITLPAGKSYQVKIERKGYKNIDEKVELKIARSGATTVVRHFLLYKK